MALSTGSGEEISSADYQALAERLQVQHHRAELRSAGPALIRALNKLINGTNDTNISHTTP